MWICFSISSQGESSEWDELMGSCWVISGEGERARLRFERRRTGWAVAADPAAAGICSSGLDDGRAATGAEVS